MDLRSLDILAPKALLEGRYRIVRLIGRGGMGAVYEATDLRLKLPVALKQTLASGAQFRKAFQREALLLARLRHPALPVVTDYFAAGEAQFLVMQYIPGADLAALHAKRDGAFPLATVLDWADQLLGVLEYLHEQQPPIIHRDIKPQNLKLAANGSIVLLDFGLAKGAAAQSQLVSSSLFGYTPHYAPLEQIRGGGTTPGSDLYALAATLYHLLSDGPPATAMERAEASINGLPDPLAPLCEASPEVPGPISAVLTQAMALRADARPASAAAMRAALAEARMVATSTFAEGEQTTVLVERGQPGDDAAFLVQLDRRPIEALAFSSAPAVERFTAIPPSQRLSQRGRSWWIWAIVAAIVAGLGLGMPIFRANQEQPAATAAPAGLIAPPSRTNTPMPTASPTATATYTPSATPTNSPTRTPSSTPARTTRPTARPRSTPTITPLPPPPPTSTQAAPAALPTDTPPTEAPNSAPRRRPTSAPTDDTGGTPTGEPTSDAYPGPSTPTSEATAQPSAEPSAEPSVEPPAPTSAPAPTQEPTARPTAQAAA